MSASDRGWILEGRWSGEYQYSAVPGIYAGNLPPCKFTLELHDTNWGFFRGSVQDDSLTGMPEPGEIHGWRTRNLIFFLKRMPYRHVRKIDPDTKQAGSQMSRRNRRHPTILYTGRWIAERNELKGRWRFLAPFRIPGTWLATRAS